MIQLYRENGTLLREIEVSDKSYRIKEVMGENAVYLSYVLSDYLEIPLNSYLYFKGERYRLRKRENFKKVHSRNWEYTLKMEAWGADTADVKYKFFAGSDRNFKMKFPLTMKPIGFLQLLVDNMNLAGSGWKLGNVIDADEKTILFDDESCLQALAKIAEKFNTEFEIIGKTIHFKKVEKTASPALPLGYGKDKGLKSGVGRVSVDNTRIINRLYAIGGDRNIDSNKYGNSTLLLPKSKRINYLGVDYITDAHGNYIERVGLAGARVEGSEDFTHIYPSRVGTVSSVITVDAEKHFYDFTDSSIPSDLDYKKNIIPGQQMLLVFQSGALAGIEFNVNYDHDDRRFKIVPKEENGLTYPTAPDLPQSGDKYAVFNIQLPDSYITEASNKMLNDAAKALYEGEQSTEQVTGILDEVYSAKNWEQIKDKIQLGQIVSFSDEQFMPTPTLLRIVSIKDYLNSPKTPEVALANRVENRTFAQELASLKDKAAGSAYDELLKNNNYLKDIFLYKNAPDTANSHIEFKDGITANEAIATDVTILSKLHSEQFNSGFLGEGFMLQKNDLGNWDLELDNLVVRKNMDVFRLTIQEIKSVGGQLLLSPANMQCIKVQELENVYRCYFNNDDANIPNYFEIGDQALCQKFDSKGQKRYWRLVVATGNDYIDLSKTDKDGSGVPSGGDEIVQLGHRSNPSRQNAILISSYGMPKIEQFKGINTYSTAGKLVTRISPDNNLFRGTNFSIETTDASSYLRMVNNKLEINASVTFTSDSPALNDVREISEEKKQIAITAARTYTDSQLSSVNLEINDVKSAIDALQGNIDGAVSNGELDVSKISDIEAKRDALIVKKAEIEHIYGGIYNNADLGGQKKTDLSAAKSALDTTHSELITAINSAITAGAVTGDEKIAIDSKFDFYSTNINALHIALNNALAEIENNKIAQAEADAQEQIDALETSPVTPSNLINPDTTIARYENGSVTADGYSLTANFNSYEFKGFLIPVSPNKSYILTYKSPADLRIRIGYYNATPATSVDSSRYKTDIDVPQNYTITTDANTTHLGVMIYPRDLSYYPQTITNITLQIVDIQDNSAEIDAINEAKEQAIQEAQDYTNVKNATIDSELGLLGTKLIDLGTTFNGAISGVGDIDPQENATIEATTNLLKVEKEDIDSKYVEIYSNSKLSGTSKTNLNNAKSEFDTASAELINAINSSISDANVTPGEKTDIDSKFAAYGSKLSNLRVAFEKAIESIEETKIEEAKQDAIAANKAYIESKNYVEQLKHKADLDGVRTDAENKAIAIAEQKANLAKEYAIAEDERQRLLINADMDGVRDYAEHIAIQTATAKSNFAKAQAQAYADGKIDAEEQKRINALKQALADAESKARELDENLSSGDNILSDHNFKLGKWRLENPLIVKDGKSAIKVSSAWGNYIRDVNLPKGEYTICLVARGGGENGTFRVKFVEQNKSYYFNLKEEFELIKIRHTQDVDIVERFYISCTATFYVHSIAIFKGTIGGYPAPSEADRKAEIEAKAEEVKANLQAQLNAAKARLNLDIDSLGRKTNFLTETNIQNASVATGALLVGNERGVNAGVTGVDSGNNAVRFYAGSSYAGRNNAPFKVTQAGDLYATRGTIGGIRITENGLGSYAEGFQPLDGLRDMWIDNEGLVFRSTEKQYRGGVYVWVINTVKITPFGVIVSKEDDGNITEKVYRHY